jgi:hypothetical protein
MMPLNVERRRALAMLATAGRDGATRPLLTAYGFRAAPVASFVNQGLATLSSLSQTNPETVAQPSPALRLSKLRIWRARQDPRSDPSYAVDPSHPNRTTSKPADRRFAPAEAAQARSHRFGRYRSPCWHLCVAAGEQGCRHCGGAALKRLNFAHHTVSRAVRTTTAPKCKNEAAIPQFADELPAGSSGLRWKISRVVVGLTVQPGRRAGTGRAR